MSDKIMKKGERGAFDYNFDKNHEIFFVKWHDNSLVTMGTKHQEINPIASAKRWSLR